MNERSDLGGVADALNRVALAVVMFTVVVFVTLCTAVFVAAVEARSPRWCLCSDPPHTDAGVR